MAIKVPNASEVVMLKNILNHTAAQNLSLKLFTNNITPGDSDTAASYTEVVGGGYSATTLTGSSWTVATNSSGEAEATYATQTFTFTGGLTGGSTIYGYYAVQSSSGLLMFADRLPSAFTPVSNGDALAFVPTFRLKSQN